MTGKIGAGLAERLAELLGLGAVACRVTVGTRGIPRLARCLRHLTPGRDLEVDTLGATVPRLGIFKGVPRPMRAADRVGVPELDEARRMRSARSTDIGRGEFEERSRVTLREYAEPWVERYLGRGRGGFREGTRDEYRRQLEQYVLPYFNGAKLTEVTPSRVAAFVGWPCEQTRPAPTKEDKDRRVPLSDATVRNIMAPLPACLSSAVREGLIRSNPARDADLPHCSEGRNAVQVQRWLGHHSPAFTLATYVHLLDGDLGEPLAVPSEGMGACYGAIQKC